MNRFGPAVLTVLVLAGVVTIGGVMMVFAGSGESSVETTPQNDPAVTPSVTAVTEIPGSEPNGRSQ